MGQTLTLYLRLLRNLCLTYTCARGRAGYKLTVMDTSDPDWWKGKCLGKVGFFPSKYITKLQAGERPLQVTHNLQVTDGQDGMRLLRDQVRTDELLASCSLMFRVQ